MSTSALYDVAIIGAGPIGIELAVALRRAGMTFVQFDAKQIGQTISWFAPQTRFFSSPERIAIAGVPLMTPDQSKATREEYLAYLRAVVKQFDLKINTYEPVTGIEQIGNTSHPEFRLTTNPASGERTWRARNVVLSTGGTDRPRTLGIPGEKLPHVSHYFQDPHTYFDRKLLIVGGKNSAVEAALRCHSAGANVSLSYRRAGIPEEHIKYWLLPEIKGLLKTGAMPGYFQTTPVEITPTHVKLRRQVGTLAPEIINVEADFVLLLVGYEQDPTLLKLAGIRLDPPQQCPSYNPDTMESNVPGLFVAGTAVGGTQERYTVFIENCHVHVERIVRHLLGQKPPPVPEPLSQPES